MKTNELFVYLHGKKSGILSQSSSGKINFVYNPAAERILSMSLPLRKETFDDTQCFGYFNGLLPENPQMRKNIGQLLGINANNDFSLLAAIGNDCAGAVSFYKSDDMIILKEPVQIEGTALSEAELANHIKELPYKPFFSDNITEQRYSLAGIQDKAAVSIIDGKVCITKSNTPTTHILKPQAERFEGSVENEYLCMKVAADIGIEVPDVEIGQAQDIKYLLVKRYDREIFADGKISRIHQEDFCQALGIASIHKYQEETENGRLGPGFKECFEILRRLNAPALEISKFINRMIYSFLIGNNDVHGKNFSLLHKKDSVVLAPAYDILCTRIYPVGTNMAMSIGGEYQAYEVLPRHFKMFCEEVKFSFPQLKKLIVSQCKSLPDFFEKEVRKLKEDGCDEPAINAVYEYVRGNCGKVLDDFINH